jgi:peptidoglycan DL-endopeptidase RipA
MSAPQRATNAPGRGSRIADLASAGPGGSEHVALYVGGGTEIAATHTGSFVLLLPVDYGGLSGAVRP